MSATTVTVTTQAELDAALAEHGSDNQATILINSPRGVWLKIRAFGSATVEAFDSATVEASGSATVRAFGSATVRASGSATVRAFGSATVRASGSATVRASKYVAVHLRSTRVTLTGGVLIDLTALNLNDPQTWADYTGAQVTDGHVTLYKAVDGDLAAGHDYRLTTYPIGQDVTASDWRDDNNCGGGLHASAHPHQAIGYYPSAKRMLVVTVPLADVRPIGEDKCKARTVHVVHEVRLDGSDLLQAVSA